MTSVFYWFLLLFALLNSNFLLDFHFYPVQLLRLDAVEELFDKGQLHKRIFEITKHYGSNHHIITGPKDTFHDSLAGIDGVFNVLEVFNHFVFFRDVDFVLFKGLEICKIIDVFKEKVVG